MSQVVFDIIDPTNTSGTELASILNNFKNAVMSGLIGATRPDQVTAGGSWIDTSLQVSDNKWRLRLWTGTAEVTLLEINLATNSVSIPGSDNNFAITRVSEDAIGAALRLVKRRVSASQVKLGDTLGLVGFYGYTASSIETQSARFRAEAREDFTTGTLGTDFIFETTKMSENTPTEHMRMTNGKMAIGGSGIAPVETLEVAGNIVARRVAGDALASKIITTKRRTAGGGQTLLNDEVSQFVARGMDGSGNEVELMRLTTKALQDITAANQGTSWALATKKLGTNTFVDRILVDSTSVQIPDLVIPGSVQTDIDSKIPLAQKGAANGVVPLNASSLIDSIYLPSYVDDVLEYANFAAFPVSGETGKIYIAIDTGKTYRWSGTIYTEISQALSDALLFANAWRLGTNRHLETQAATDSATTGSNATLAAFTAGEVRLTNAGLVSIANIPAGSDGQVLILINRTGVDVTIFDSVDALGTAANRIYTGTTNSITMSNNAAFVLTYDSTSVRWQIVGGTGSGSGGGAGLDTVVQFTASEQLTSWVTGNNAVATPTAGGTFAGSFVKETAAPIHGTASYKYTQAAGSLNDFIFSPVFAVDKGFRLSGPIYTALREIYDGLSTDIALIFWDATNAMAIPLNTTTFIEGTNGAVKNMIFAVDNIPSTCLAGRIGFQVKALNSGKIFTFDDIEVGSSLSSFTSISTIITENIEAVSPTTTWGSTSTNVPVITISKNSNKGVIQVVSSAAGGTRFKAIVKCKVDVTFNFTGTSTNGSTGQIFVGSNVVSQAIMSAVNNTSIVLVSTSVVLLPGEELRFERSNNTLTTLYSTTLTAVAESSAFLSALNQISSDTLPFTFKATAITAADPIGTFNTFTYASGGNVATISGSAPTQTSADMNANGVRVFQRPFNANSTTASPARIDIKIGTGLRASDIQGYAGTTLTLPVFTDFIIAGSERQGMNKTYNSLTGILSFDAGFSPGTVTNATFKGAQALADNSYSSAYFTFTASAAPSMAALPFLQPRIATLSDVKSNLSSGGASISGAQTRVLNTLFDPTGIVLSLSVNVFTLGAGTYYIEASAPAYNPGRHNIKLRNTTDSVNVIQGSAEYTVAVDSQTRSTLSGEFTITSAKSFIIQHFITSANGTEGLGVSGNTGSDSSVFTLVKIQKLR